MQCAPDLFEVFDERPGVAPVRVGRVDALGGEVVELLEVRVHHDLLLVGVLERLRPGNESTHSCQLESSHMTQVRLSDSFIYF